jgi:hypothetical protein
VIKQSPSAIDLGNDIEQRHAIVIGHIDILQPRSGIFVSCSMIYAIEVPHRGQSDAPKQVCEDSEKSGPIKIAAMNKCNCRLR